MRLASHQTWDATMRRKEKPEVRISYLSCNHLNSGHHKVWLVPAFKGELLELVQVGPQQLANQEEVLLQYTRLFIQKME